MTGEPTVPVPTHDLLALREKAWPWIKIARNHSPKASPERNALALLDALAARVETLEQENERRRAIVDAALFVHAELLLEGVGSKESWDDFFGAVEKYRAGQSTTDQP